MIPHLSEENKNDWDRQMRYYNRRQKRSNTWSTIRFFAGLLFAIVVVTAAIRACNEVTWTPKPSDFVADSLYVDSVINGHTGLERIHSDTAPPMFEFKKAIDTRKKREDISIHFLTGPPDTPYMTRSFTGGCSRIRYNGKVIARMAADSTRWQILDSGAWLRAHIFYRKMNLKKWEDSL